MAKKESKSNHPYLLAIIAIVAIAAIVLIVTSAQDDAMAKTAIQQDTTGQASGGPMGAVMSEETGGSEDGTRMYIIGENINPPKNTNDVMDRDEINYVLDLKGDGID